MCLDNSGEPATWDGPTICCQGSGLNYAVTLAMPHNYLDMNELHLIVIQPRKRVLVLPGSRHVLSVVQQGYKDTAGVTRRKHHRPGIAPNANTDTAGVLDGFVQRLNADFPVRCRLGPHVRDVMILVT